MDLRPTEEQQALAEALSGLAAWEIRPAARGCEEAGEVSAQIRRQFFEMGLAAPAGEEFGGQGTLDAVTALLVAEEVAWGDPGIAYALLATPAAAALVDLAGTPEQRVAVLPLLAGGAAGAIAAVERDAGADFTEMEAMVSGQGGETVLAGTKYGVPGFDTAAVRLLVARRDERLGAFLLAPGASLPMEREDKLGLRAAATFRLRLDGAAVDAEPLGGQEGSPERLTRALLRWRILHAGIALGLARAAVDYASAYARERTAFGRPIGAFQGISFKIADRATDLDAARLLAWQAAWALDGGAGDPVRLVAAATAHALSVAVACADDAVQVLGGHGYMRDHPVEMWYRDAMTLAALDSPTLVGDMLLAQEYGAAGVGPAAPRERWSL